MSFLRATASLALVGFILTASFACADDKAKKDPAADDKEVLKSTGKPRPTAASVNFRKELGLPFQSLNTLGTRVDAARRAHDPVTLSNAANELATAEKVSGKKASLTSPQLLKESIMLAKLRRQDKELQAVLHATQQLQGEADDIASLQDSITLAKQAIAADKEQVNSNLEPTWAPRTLVVNNYTTQYLDIYVNGNFKGQVAPGMQQTYTIEHRWNPTILTADGDEDSITYGPQTIWGRFKKYTWNVD
jgi:predicted ribosome quality control (RQC) complex YloA/Tae2 family protein